MVQGFRDTTFTQVVSVQSWIGPSAFRGYGFCLIRLSSFSLELDTYKHILSDLASNVEDCQHEAETATKAGSVIEVVTSNVETRGTSSEDVSNEKRRVFMVRSA